MQRPPTDQWNRDRVIGPPCPKNPKAAFCQCKKLLPTSPDISQLHFLAGKYGDRINSTSLRNDQQSTLYRDLSVPHPSTEQSLMLPLLYQRPM